MCQGIYGKKEIRDGPCPPRWIEQPPTPRGELLLGTGRFFLWFTAKGMKDTKRKIKGTVGLYLQV